MKKLTLVVIRILQDGSLAQSKPCHHCTMKLKLYGIRKIYYSNEKGEIVKEKASDIQSDHISLGNRKIR